MKISNLVGLAGVAITLFLLAAMAVHLDPKLAGVIGAILFGTAAIITAINRHRGDSSPAQRRNQADTDKADDADADATSHQ